MQVKMIAGTYGHNERSCITAKTKDSPSFELDDAKAQRLIALGVAEEVKEGAEKDSGSMPPQQETAADNTATNKLKAMTCQELKKRAKEMGLPTTGKQAELIERISIAEANEPDGDMEANKQPPELSAALPEL